MYDPGSDLQPATHTVEAMYHRHHAKLLAYAKRHSSEDNEDVAQDVWLKVLEATQKGNGHNQHESGWLYRIAHNRIIDHYRKRDREPQWLYLDDAEDAREDEGDRGHTVLELCARREDSLEEQVEKLAMYEMLYRALGTIAESQAEIILQRMEGREYTEIAAEMGCTAQACKQTATRAYASLYAKLAKWMGICERRTNLQASRLPAVLAVVKAHGAITSNQLSKELRMSKSTAYHYLARSGEFVRVGVVPSSRGDAILWALANTQPEGVGHD